MKNHRLGFNNVFTHILKPWSKQNTYYLQKIVDKKEVQVKIETKNTFTHNYEAFIVDYNGWSAKTSKYFSVNIFIELSRSNFLIMYNEILQESNEIKNLTELPTKDYKVLWSMKKSKYFSESSDIAIMMYKQSDIVKMLFLLTEKIDQLPFDSVEEVEHIVKLLYTRNGIFFCQDNIDENIADAKMTPLEYATFSSIYFHAIQRRLFYYGIISKEPISIPFEKCKKWIETEVCAGLGTDGFEDCYAKSCEESYHFPGDDEWFKQRYPEAPVQTGPILDCFRKEMAKKYFTDYRSSLESVLAVYNQPTHQGQCSRTFIINALEQYMKIHYSIPWKEGVVIKNDAIEGSKRKLFRKSEPYIVQVYSRFCVYDDSKIYPCDDLYQTFAYWVDTLKRKHGGKLFGVDLESLVKKVL